MGVTKQNLIVNGLEAMKSGGVTRYNLTWDWLGGEPKIAVWRACDTSDESPPGLFAEFRETGISEKLGFRVPEDLRNAYPSFFWKAVKP